MTKITIKLITFSLDHRQFAWKNRNGTPKPACEEHLAQRLETFYNIIDKSTADLIVFPGWTIPRVEVSEIVARCGHFDGTVIFEMYDPVPIGEDSGKNTKKIPGKDPNHKKSEKQDDMNQEVFILQDGKILEPRIKQVFAFSSDVEGTKGHDKVKELVDQLKTHRVVPLPLKERELKMLLLICGEINILKNLQKENNEVVFRVDTKEGKLLEEKFKEVLKDSHLIVNPQHTPMGNQGKMARRREYFSKDNRVYCSTTNLDPQKLFKTQNDEIEDVTPNEIERCLETYDSLQYVLHNKKTVPMENPVRLNTGERNIPFIAKKYQIDFDF